MQPRAVRVPLLEAYVRFNGFDATLVNISRSGALLRMREPVEVGANARLTLSQRSTTIEIDGKVVRAVRGGATIVDIGDDRHVGYFVRVAATAGTAGSDRALAPVDRAAITTWSSYGATGRD